MFILRCSKYKWWCILRRFDCLAALLRPAMRPGQQFPSLYYFWPRHASSEMDVKTVDVIVKTNLGQFFTVCTHADNSNDVKLSKTLQWNTRLRLVVLLQWVLDLNILTSFLWSIRVQTIAICATSETRMKLGRVNFRKAFRGCYWRKRKGANSSIALPSNYPRRLCDS